MRVRDLLISILLFQQVLNAPGHLRLAARALPFQLAFPAVAYPALPIYQVDRRPVLLPPAAPVLAVPIHQNRIGDAAALDLPRDVRRDLLLLRLRRMHADEDNALLLE